MCANTANTMQPAAVEVSAPNGTKRIINPNAQPPESEEKIVAVIGSQTDE